MPVRIVFSHGFGVEKTSAGMFSDIAKSLPVGYEPVLFDYYHIARNKWYVPGINDMVNNLKSEVATAYKDCDKVIIIAHSQGCTIASIAEVNVDKVIFLAPPTRTITGDFKHYFVNKRSDRARIDDAGNVHLTRKRDNQELIISNDWFSEMVNNDSFHHMKQLAKTGKLTIIEATEDEDIKDRRKYDQLEKLGAIRIPIKASHNFDTPARAELLKSISNLI